MRLLIGEDDRVTREFISQQCEWLGFEVFRASSVESIVEELRKFKYDVVILDIWLEGINSLEMLPKWISECPSTSFIVLTAHGSYDVAVEAMRLGASHFFVKPIESDRLHAELARYLPDLKDQECLRRQRALLEQCGMIGSSPPLLRLAKMMLKTESLDSTVLIEGETGSGKELVARGLHLRSKRSLQPFEAVNCGVLPVNLVESELFGHAKGAFTDAKERYIGIFERAKGGTVFLDEIAELPLPIQAKLLRVLQEKSFNPVGSSQKVALDARLITATNQPLKNLVAKGAFRADLYYRIKVIDMYVPPLRQRQEDIPLLVKYFVQFYAKKFDRLVYPPHSEVMRRLINDPWPGNIRELQHLVERAVALCEGSELTLKDFFLHSSEEACDSADAFKAAELASFEAEKNQFEKNYLIKVLRESKGNVSEAAKIAGKFRSDFYRLMSKYEINPEDFRTNC